MSILNQISQSQLSANTSSEGVQSDNKNNTNTDNTLLSPKDKIKVTSQIDPLKQSNLAPLPGSATGIFTSQINPLNKSNLAPISGSVRGISTSQINPLNKSNLGPVLNIPNNRVGVTSQINPLNKSNLAPAPATSQNFIQTSFDGSKITIQSIIPIINPTPAPTGLLEVVNVTTGSITVDFTGGEISSYSVGEVLSTSPQNCDNISETLIYNPVDSSTMTFDFYAGSINKSFDPGTGFDSISGVSYLYALAKQSDGKILVGGEFTSYSGSNNNNIVRINPDGSKDTSFDIGTGFNGSVFNISIQSDGKILVGGSFTTYQGVSSNYIIRLNADGSKDTSFDIGTGFSFRILTISIQSDGKIIAGGQFSTYQGISANEIIRLNSDGSRDTSFDIGTGFNNRVRSIAIQSDGKIIVGGGFTSYQGVASNYIIRLNADGSKDTSFDIGTGFNNNIINISIQSDGKIILGGIFTSYQGISANRIIRLNADGSKDTSFDIGTGFNSTVNTIAIQSNGKILVSGPYETYQGISANQIIRLNSDGSIDQSFITGTGVFWYIDNIFIEDNGDIILISQSLNSYNEIIFPGIIKLNNDNNNSCYCITATDTLGAQYETGLICLLPESTP